MSLDVSNVGNVGWGSNEILLIWGLRCALAWTGAVVGAVVGVVVGAVVVVDLVCKGACVRAWSEKCLPIVPTSPVVRQATTLAFSCFGAHYELFGLSTVALGTSSWFPGIDKQVP